MKGLIRIGIIFLCLSGPGWAGPPRDFTIRYTKGAQGRPSEMQARGTIKATPAAIWDALVRINDWSSFMPRLPASFYITDEGVAAIQNAPTRNAHQLKKIAERYRTDVLRKSGGRWQGSVFQIVNTPFPVENRWFVLRYTNDETLARRDTFRQCWEMIAANVNSVRGCYHVQPDGEAGHSLVHYEEIVDLGGHVPDWVARIGVRSTTPDVFESLEKEAGRS